MVRQLALNEMVDVLKAFAHTFFIGQGRSDSFRHYKNSGTIAATRIASFTAFNGSPFDRALSGRCMGLFFFIFMFVTSGNVENSASTY